MSKFTQLTLTVDGETVNFLPYDRGTAGAFVFRQGGLGVHAPRLVFKSNVDDMSSDRYTIQLNQPKVCDQVDECDMPNVLGTDLVKLELRFLATTSSADRNLAIDTLVAALEELRGDVENREVMYS